MTGKRTKPKLSPVKVLKIDKDCFVDENWMRDYLDLILYVCWLMGVKVIAVRMCRSQHKGLHFYIEIQPAVDAKLANRIQWLLGDDCQRVNFNRARIDSGLDEWNKLFEQIGTRLRTVYNNRARHCNKRNQRGGNQVGSFARLKTAFVNWYSSSRQQSSVSVHLSQFEAVCKPTLTLLGIC